MFIFVLYKVLSVTLTQYIYVISSVIATQNCNYITYYNIIQLGLESYYEMRILINV